MFRNLIFISILFIIFSCATEEIPPKVIPQQVEQKIEKAPPLVPMEEILYDAYSGKSLGKVKFINDELTFVVLVDMKETITQKKVYDDISEETKIVSI